MTVFNDTHTMKAIVWTAYGSPDVLKLREVTKPTPGKNELLIQVKAATVTAGDCEARSLEFPFLFSLPMRLYIGIRKPSRITILGQELAGVVEAVGQDVLQFKPGDEVVAATLFRFGAYAEYACVPESHPIMLKPDNMTFDEATTIPTGGMNALHFLKRAKLEPGDNVLIVGAGGSIGTYAIQIAKSFGAEVTAVDSTGKLDMLRSIGADHVIDYTSQDFTQSGETYDAIIDVVGKSPYSSSVRSLKPGGRYVLGNVTLSGAVRGQWTSATSDKTVSSTPAGYPAENMQFLRQLIEASQVRAIVDRRYPLEETAEAHRYVETGQKLGNVVISMDHDLDG